MIHATDTMVLVAMFQPAHRRHLFSRLSTVAGVRVEQEFFDCVSRIVWFVMCAGVTIG